LDPGEFNSTSTDEQVEVDGNLHRRHTRIQPEINLGEQSYLSVTHEFQGGTYNPGVCGALNTIDFSVEAIIEEINVTGGSLVIDLVIIQDGIIYTRRTPNITVYNQWESRELIGVTASGLIDSEGKHPDFSASGAPMSFGYRHAGVKGSVREVRAIFGLDNWNVTVWPVSEQPDTPVTIDFDDLTSIPEGSSARIAEDQFQSLGVIISMIDPDTGNLVPFVVVEHLVSGNGAHSLPYSVAFGYKAATVEIRFVDPATGTDAVTDFVSAWVGDKSSETDTITMTAYDLAGNEIGSASYTAQPSAQLDDATDFGLVEIHAEGIHRVVFTDNSPSGGDFDDLTFNPPTVP
jgi:hypothetical protein